MLIFAGSKCKCLCDILPCGRCLACHPVSEQCSCRWQNSEDLPGNNQVLQSLFTEPAMHKKCRLTSVCVLVLCIFGGGGGGEGCSPAHTVVYSPLMMCL